MLVPGCKGSWAITIMSLALMAAASIRISTVFAGREDGSGFGTEALRWRLCSARGEQLDVVGARRICQAEDVAIKVVVLKNGI